jgi:elongation factor Ts
MAAMHIAASKPICVSEDQVSAETIEKEKDIFRAQAAESGKPADIIEKMVAGRISKFFAEVTLLGQPFIKDDKLTVGKLAASNNNSVVRFARFEVGEGIEKKEENFAEEVMAQVRGS